MSAWHVWHDWLGGYPFGVATPGALLDFYHERGFELIRLKTAGGSVGCNEVLFTRSRSE